MLRAVTLLNTHSPFSPQQQTFSERILVDFS